MATSGSALANVLKRSLTVSSTLGEKVTWTWSDAAKKLHEEYERLLKLHDSIQTELKTEWKDLGTEFDGLVAKMKKLENTTVSTDDTVRKKYTTDVSQYIAEAEKLAKRVREKKASEESVKREEAEKLQRQQAEAQKRKELGPGYNTASAMLDDVLAYTGANDVKGNRDFAQVKDWIKWRDSGAPSVGQMSAIIEGVKKVKDVVGAWSKQQASNKTAELEKQQKEAARKKLDEDRLKERQEKDANIEAERKKKVGPVRDLLKEVLKEAKDELAEFNKLDAKLDGFGKTYAADKKFAPSLQRVSDLRKQMTLDGRKTLGTQTPTLKDVVQSLEDYESGLDKLSVPDLESLSRELPKVRERVDAFEDQRTGTDGYADLGLALDPKLAVRPATDTKSTGYVFTEDLDTAEKYKKDMIGILAGARAGRTSPNGKANHIHVGGDATNNVIFDRNGPGGAVRVLGFVDGHMDKRMPPPVRSEAGRIEDRASSGAGSFTAVEVDTKDRSFKAV